MAEFTGTISPGDIDTVYSRTVIALGTRIKDTEGNEYIFLNGVASCVEGSWITYDEEYITTLLATAALGPIGIAKAAIVYGKYGWFQIWGVTIGCAKSSDDGTLSDNACVGRSASDGYVDSDYTAGDLIYAAISRSAMEASSSNTTTLFQIYYPWVDAGTEGH